MALFVLSYKERKVLLFILSLIILGFTIKFLSRYLSHPLVQIRRKEDRPACIDINKATLKELESLPGIGEHLARAIIEMRKRALFGEPEELLRVRGIGKKKLEIIRKYLCPDTFSKEIHNKQ